MLLAPRDFLFPFFFFLFLSFLPLSFSFSPCCLLEWVYWEYRRFCRDLLYGRELCAEEEWKFVGVNGCEADGFA